MVINQLNINMGILEKVVREIDVNCHGGSYKTMAFGVFWAQKSNRK